MAELNAMADATVPSGSMFMPHLPDPAYIGVKSSARVTRTSTHSRRLMEDFFCRLKQFRAIATRCDKTARHFLAAIDLVASTTWIN